MTLDARTRTVRGTLLAALLACGTAAAEAPPQASPPALATISAEANAALQRLAAMKQSIPEVASTPPRTLEEWDQRAAGVARLAVYMQPIIERLGPAVSEVQLGGVAALKVVPRGRVDPGRVLMYVHGGAYTALSARLTLATAALEADAAGLTVYSIDYTVAPRGNWHTATDQVIAAYRGLLALGWAPRSIGLFGDSAGGGLVAGSTLKLRDTGLPLPGALVLLSPWSDISGSGDTYTTLAAAEPLLSLPDLAACAAAYAAPADQRNPYVSPVYGDYTKGFPPTLIQGGTREIFLSNFVRQYRAIDSAGGVAVLDLYEGMPHVFQLFMPEAPEARTAFAKASAFWREHLTPSRR